jgi:hypothetical protein
MFKSALLVAASIVVGAGAVQLLHAAGSPPLFTVAEINVKDRAAYEKDLPSCQSSEVSWPRSKPGAKVWKQP